MSKIDVKLDYVIKVVDRLPIERKSTSSSTPEKCFELKKVKTHEDMEALEHLITLLSFLFLILLLNKRMQKTFKGFAVIAIFCLIKFNLIQATIG